MSLTTHPTPVRRIGIVTPSSNTRMEPAVYRLLSGTPSVTAHFARVAVTRIALDADSDRQFDPARLRSAAEQLADASVDVLVWGGTAGSWLGTDHDERLCAELTEATGIPATTTTLALRAAMRAYGVARIGLLVPYTDDVAARIAAGYAAAGIEVVAQQALGLTDNASFADVPADRVAELIRALSARAHAVAVVCTNLTAAETLAATEAATGIPVLDSVAATVWAGLGGASLPGRGELLGSGWLRSRLQGVVDALLEQTGADRTTLRLDLPSRNLGVDVTAAESVRPGVRSIRRDSSLDQRALHTVRWLAGHHRLLVQPHFRDDPRPPEALVQVYGVRAQVLAPLRDAGDGLPGWLSVHSRAERDWTESDLAAVRLATEHAQQIIDNERGAR